MATMQQQVEVAADRPLVGSAWARFIQWAHTGPGHLRCDDLACVDAIPSGLVDFVPTANGGTDYLERSGFVHRKPTETGETAFEVEAGRKGDKPRHVRLSREEDTTFWRGHFPT